MQAQDTLTLVGLCRLDFYLLKHYSIVVVKLRRNVLTTTRTTSNHHLISYSEKQWGRRPTTKRDPHYYYGCWLPDDVACRVCFRKQENTFRAVHLFFLMFPSEKDNILKRYVEEGVAGSLPGLVAQHTMDTFYDSSVITAR